MTKRRDKLKRRKNKREAKTIFIIYCDGETEKNYFKSFKVKLKDIGNVKILVKDAPNPLQIVKRLIKEKITVGDDGYYFWGVCDVDERYENIKEVIKEAKKDNIKLAISNPCFEYWILLHFKKTRPIYSKCNPIINELKKHIQNYDKNDRKIYNKISQLEIEAIKRAKEYGFKNKNLFESSEAATTVYKLVDELNTFLQNT